MSNITENIEGISFDSSIFNGFMKILLQFYEHWNNELRKMVTESKWGLKIRSMQLLMCCFFSVPPVDRQIVGEYEKTISQLIAEKEREKASMETTLQTTVKERDQAIEDLKVRLLFSLSLSFFLSLSFIYDTHCSYYYLYVYHYHSNNQITINHDGSRIATMPELTLRFNTTTTTCNNDTNTILNAANITTENWRWWKHSQSVYSVDLYVNHL